MEVDISSEAPTQADPVTLLRAHFEAVNTTIESLKEAPDSQYRDQRLGQLVAEKQGLHVKITHTKAPEEQLHVQTLRLDKARLAVVKSWAALMTAKEACEKAEAKHKLDKEAVVAIDIDAQLAQAAVHAAKSAATVVEPAVVPQAALFEQFSQFVNSFASQLSQSAAQELGQAWSQFSALSGAQVRSQAVALSPSQ